MSSVEVIKPEKSKQFTSWRAYPLEIKIMDLASLAWIAITVINIVFAFIIDLNFKTLATVFLPILMLIFTVSLRLELIDHPERLRRVFITWVILFALSVITSIVVVAIYPGIIGS